MAKLTRSPFSALDTVFVPIHRAGFPFIAGGAALTLLAAALSDTLGLILAILTLWCVYFFRNPDRVTPVRDGLIVSPADGRVQMIARAAPPADIDMAGGERTRVSIFLNIFDVHVNRVPATGRIDEVVYRPGKYLNASLDKASEENERSAASLELPDGRKIAFVQIAGLVARRIVSELKPGQEVTAGERYGLIRFGSRVDIYLPEGVAPLVVAGQRVLGGETVIADLQSNETLREAVIH